MLRQSLIPVFGDTQQATAILERAGVDPTMRGEALTMADFHRIGRARPAPAPGETA
jgi:16S rRNA (adenine1518-N6/adenine1519-N6)-dimethyltransferase